MRENVFTVFAGAINACCDHKMTKEALFETFVGCLEIADENERTEKKSFIKKMDDWRGDGSLENMIVEPRPYSNYEEALKMLR